MGSNFDFLEECFPQLAQMGREAEVHYLNNFDDSCAYKMRKIEESIVNEMLHRHNTAKESAGGDSNERINYLYHCNLIDDDIRRILHNLRLAGNKSAHDTDDIYCTDSCVLDFHGSTLSRLKQTYTLTVWFMQTYGDAYFVAEEFAPPLTKTVISDVLQNEDVEKDVVENIEPEMDQPENVAVAPTLLQLKPLDITLTDLQRKAVESENNRVVVVAGPGSGKTRVITERICHLIFEKHERPQDIIALTFTTKAANEMKSRIINRAGPLAKDINVRTFHSFGLQILRDFSDRIGLQQDFAIVDNTTKNRMIRNIMKELHVPKDQLINVSSYINRRKNGDQSVSTINEEIYNKYENDLTENNLIDLDDMICKALKLLQDDEKVKAFYGNRFSHILVDEFQDANKLQVDMLKAIISNDNHFFIVGDDDQCIYEWRGSSPAYLNRFVNAADQNEVIKLLENFRSTQQIVAMSDHLIHHNQSRIQKTMRAFKKHFAKGKKLSIQPVDGEAVQYQYFASEEKQAEFYADEILRLHKKYAYEFNQFAVLLRSNNLGDPIKKVLDARNIPYFDQISEQTGYDSFVQILHTVKSLYKKNYISKAVNYPNRILDQILFTEICEKYNLPDMEPLEAFQYLYDHKLDFDGSIMFRGRYEILMELNKNYQKLTVSEIVAKLLHYYESESIFGTDQQPSPLDYVKNILEIANEFDAAYSNDNRKSQLSDFLDYLEISLHDDRNAEHIQGEVQLMTCHKAKGLEFPVVFIPGVQPGIFPNDYFIKTTKNLEEERRLLYVTMTRAMERLYLTCYENPHFNPKANSIVTKGFISEMPHLITNKKV